MVFLAGEEFLPSDFSGIGHTEILVASGTRPAEARWPERIFARMLEDTANKLQSSSVTSIALTTGVKTFTIAENLPVPPNGGFHGQAIDRANGANNFFFVVDTYDATTLVVVTDALVTNDISGSGTKTDWIIQFATGRTGNTGPTGPGSGDMLIATFDPAGVSEQLLGETATQTMSNKTFADVIGTHQVTFTADGDVDIYLSAQEGETLVDFIGISSDAATTFDADLKVDGVVAASIATVADVEKNDNTFTADSPIPHVPEGSKLTVTITNFTGSGSGNCWAETFKNIIQN